MGSKICMNASCGTDTTQEWKIGWPLGYGGYADLCYTCGYAYEKSIFCETFHLEQSGWRECYICSKPLHCGCIASKSLVELLDYCGVGCTSCAVVSQLKLRKKDENSGGIGSLLPGCTENRTFHSGIDGVRLSFLCKNAESDKPDLLSQFQRGDPESGSSVLDIRDIREPVAQPSLSMPLGEPSATPNSDLRFSKWVAKGKEKNIDSAFQKLPQSSPFLIKPSKFCVATPSETSRSAVTQVRATRPTVDGRGKNHLLARYLPRFTDQELQQLSGELNSSIVPLFEKVLSASDAGRVGRLVLPKACAEAYFPSINQSEGIPVKIQDVKGNEWMFQFRFWPNNNSRMYVLEGVTPCIQSMQLQAGDTVTFSRIDPGGKLVMGFRKATNTEDQPDLGTSATLGGTCGGETSSPGLTQNIKTVSRTSLKLKGSKDPHINDEPKNLSASDDGDTNFPENEKRRCQVKDDTLHHSIPKPEKKGTQNIGSKSKRLLMHSEDVLQLKLTWEEAQDLLHPPPSAKPTIVIIEDHEFEEYDEPPVFGKRTIFTSRPSGEQEQWAQYDDCSKRRRLPADALLPPKWTGADTVCDANRCSCSMPDEMSTQESENFVRVGRDFKKRRTLQSHNNNSAKEREPSGLDALASAAVLGDSLDSSVAATTKHPRHRPGCTCIVCIQPPSGKGKHKPTCSCNVCMTVKRRFKTLMLRKKKLQPEHQEVTNQAQNDQQDDAETHQKRSDKERGRVRIQVDAAETSTAKIDLNCHPYREDMQQPEDKGLSIISLLQASTLPFENSAEQNGVPTGLRRDQEVSLGSSSL